MANYTGKRLDGRYEVGELVGIGGMANVYKAYDHKTGLTVAVKILKEDLASNDEFLRRFRNESKAVSVLSHPNIVKVYDVNFTDKINYIVMEYIDGITLKEYIERSGALPYKEALHFTVQILRALGHAHDNGIVHRDIKPHNIMLLQDGSIKVTDFGIAKFARAKVDTVQDKAIGSVHYISPEQARGEATGPGADIYSTGVVLYEMLSGTLPFEADSAVSVAIKQIEAQPKPLGEINPNIPEGIVDITERAMQKNAAMRYQSTAEMLKDISEFRKNPSIHFEYKYLSGAEIPPAKNTAKTRRNSVKKSNFGNTLKEMLKKYLAEPPNDEKGSDEDMKSPLIPALAGVAAAFVLGTGIFVFSLVSINSPFEKTEDVLVPDLVGLKYDVVKSSVNYDNFIIEVDGTAEYNDEYERGEIFEQKPAAGRTVKSGSKVVVRVSAGVEIITLPDFVGEEATSVFGKIRALGLEYTQADVFSSTVPSGFVVSTDPGKGSELKAGDTVSVRVSMGPDNKVVQVPDLGGKSLEEARAALSEAGLSVGSIEYRDSEAQSGTVIGQDPVYTSQVSEGAYVNLTLSSGDAIINSITLYVRLADNLPTIINVSATQDGEQVIGSQQLQPSLVRVWKPTFVGNGTANVKIYVDGKLYMEYGLDFDNEVSTLLTDNSSEW